MPELLVLNPAPKRRRKSRKPRSAAQRAATARMLAANRHSNPAKRRRGRRANPVTAVRSRVRRAARRNPVRSRRSYRRRNPISMASFRMSGVMNILKNAAIGGVGAVGVDFLMDKINPHLPASLQPSAAGTGIGVNDAVRAGLTILLGRLASRATKGLSEKMAAGALTVQAADIVRVLAAQYMPSSVAGIGYMNPAAVSRGTARISPIVRLSPGGMAAFAPRGTRSPQLSAFSPRGTRSPQLNRGSAIAAREGVRYR